MTTVYLSSTFQDLETHREAVVRLLRQSGVNVMAMEDYIACDERPVDKCLADVRRADLYVGLLAFRYGYVPPAEQGNAGGLSITELEYRTAITSGKPRLCFVVKQGTAWNTAYIDAMAEGGNGEPIKRLRAELLRERMASEFSSADQLAGLVVAAVTQHLSTATSPSPQPAANQRAQETAWLQGLLAGELSGHEARYVPVAGRRQRAQSLDRAIKGLRIQTHSLLQRFGVPEAALAVPEPQPFADVLDAYLALPGQAIRRLAVLGEPGAGKSFSLERVAVHHARAALADPAASVPVLVKLGLWTDASEPLQAFVERQMGPPLGHQFASLRDARRVVLLLDGLNEIPPGQRTHKALELRTMAEDERFAAVLVSCRERDFQDDFALPFDRLTLQALTPPQVHGFLHQLYTLAYGKTDGTARAEARFWQLAGGTDLAGVWAAWQAAGASFEQFWTAEDIPRDNPNVFGSTSGDQDNRWRQMRADRRSLMALAANPYLLTVLAALPTLPATRAALFEGFLQQLHERERLSRELKHDAASVPPYDTWQATLVAVAQALQAAAPVLASTAGNASDTSDTGGETHSDAPSANPAGAGAATSLPKAAWPTALTPAMLQFSIDASVLQRAGDDVRFTHQLLQESQAARVLLQACTQPSSTTAALWPAARWWQRNGWEVVAELAAEHCAGEAARLHGLLHWLATQQPEVAARAWMQAGAPALPAALCTHITSLWPARLTDAQPQAEPAARAAIGRALAAFGLDQRTGVGLGADGLPDIDWVPIHTPKRWSYQGKPHKPLPPFDIARYPVTHRQFQAFINAGGYAAATPWWHGLERPDGPANPGWNDANAPRERVDWFEATAFCRWLSAATAQRVHLPTEQQWERVAAGMDGHPYPWGADYAAGRANCNEPGSDIEGGTYLQRTSAVGIYPWPSREGVHDLAGNVWEWTDSWYDKEETSRVLRGGSWYFVTRYLRAADRGRSHPDVRNYLIGFRLCRSSPIE